MTRSVISHPVRRSVSAFWQLVDPVNQIDREISRRVSELPPSPLDTAMKELSTAANHSVLWFGIALALAVRRGASRKAAARGALAIAGASTVANAVMKPLLPRRRPAASELPAYQTLKNPPTSSSFPSGHSASAAAFATAVALESPRLGLAVAPLAAGVAYSRVHVGVHWATDVAVGAAVGSGVALATRRWWPVRRTDEAAARPAAAAPALVDGTGLVVLVNPRSGDPDHDPAEDLRRALPRAVVVSALDGPALDQQLEEVIDRSPSGVRAIGVAGGDGTVAAGATVAERRGLPLMVVPVGTLNHFARDVGVYDLQEAVDATGTGQAVAVDLGVVLVHRDDVSPVSPADAVSEGVQRTRHFLNTASLGSYPELVRLRQRWQPRLGKWPAFAVALLTVLRRSEPVEVRFLGRWRTVWFVFVGNGPYHPRGAVPAWRPRLDTGLLDVRWLRADVPFSRVRVAAALLLGALGHSRVYGEAAVPELEAELRFPGMLATDGEVVEEAGRFTFRVADGRIPVYRRDERRWTGRDRPYVG